MAKQIYLVRHGLTLSNEAERIQGFDDPLSEKGKKQAEILADRLSRISFDKFLCSDMLRTRQTAEIIVEKTKHEIEFSPLFREIQYPTSLINLSRSDPRILEYWKSQEENSKTNPEWKQEDEESIAELIARIKAGFDYAAGQPEDSVVVITHGNFLRKLVLILLLGTDAFKYWTERNALMVTANTGITLFSRHDNDPDWQLITWNDHAHLG